MKVEGPTLHEFNNSFCLIYGIKKNLEESKEVEQIQSKENIK